MFAEEEAEARKYAAEARASAHRAEIAAARHAAKKSRAAAERAEAIKVAQERNTEEAQIKTAEMEARRARAAADRAEAIQKHEQAAENAVTEATESQSIAHPEAHQAAAAAATAVSEARFSETPPAHLDTSVNGVTDVLPAPVASPASKAVAEAKADLDKAKADAKKAAQEAEGHVEKAQTSTHTRFESQMPAAPLSVQQTNVQSMSATRRLLAEAEGKAAAKATPGKAGKGAMAVHTIPPGSGLNHMGKNAVKKALKHSPLAGKEVNGKPAISEARIVHHGLRGDFVEHVVVEEKHLPGTHISIFSINHHFDLELFSIIWAAILGVTLVIEHVGEHIGEKMEKIDEREGTNLQRITGCIQKELMILGGISFTMALVSDVIKISTRAKHTFEYAHITIFVMALLYIGGSLITAGVLRRIMTFWDLAELRKGSRLTATPSVEDLDVIFMNLKEHFSCTFSGRIFTDPRSCFGSRYFVLRYVFRNVWRLPKHFDFALYRRLCFTEDVIHVLDIKWYSWIGIVLVPLLVWIIERIAHNHFYISLDVLWIFTFVGWVMYSWYYAVAFFLECETKKLLIRSVANLNKYTAEEIDAAALQGRFLVEDVLSRRHLFLRIMLQVMKLQSAFYAALFLLSFWRADVRLETERQENDSVSTVWVVMTLFPIITNFLMVQPMLMQSWSVFQSVFTLRPRMLQDTIRLSHENHHYRKKIAYMIVRYIECGKARDMMLQQGMAPKEVEKKSDVQLLKWLKSQSDFKIKPPHMWSEEEALDLLYPVFKSKDSDGGGLLDMEEVNEMLVGLIGFKLLPRDIEAMERVLDPERSGITYEKFRLNLVCAEMLTEDDEAKEDSHVQAVLEEHTQRQARKNWLDRGTIE
jgi:hypothetical protein